MAKFQVNGLAGRKIIVQPSQLNNGFITITIESKDGQTFEPISLDAVDANNFANAIETEAQTVHAKYIKKAVVSGEVTA